jgi:hypothetical protein
VVRVLHEGSRGRTAWDAVAVVLVLVGGLVVPYQIAFQHRVGAWGSAVVYLLDFFFLVDIFLNLRTSYRQGGQEVTDPDAIARRYGRTLLPLDLAAAIPVDAVMMLIAGQMTFGGVQVVLLLRLNRLLRLVRLFAILRRWERLSWTHPGYLRIAKFGFPVLLFLHWTACAWFFIPFAKGFPQDSWVVRQGIEQADSFTQYVRSLYWAIVTTTTVGYGDITPTRNEEYIFTMLVMLTGATVYAMIIGNIASLLSNLDATKARFWSRAEDTVQYLRVRRVPAELTDHVRDYQEYLWARNRGLDESEMFGDLPPSTRLEITTSLMRDLLDAVPLFQESTGALRNVLLRALRPQIYAPGDVLAYEGELGDGIYFISRGTVEVRSSEGGVHAELGAGEHFGDLSLMLGERRSASATASDYCDVFILPALDFERIKRDYPEFKELLGRVSSVKSQKLSELLLQGVVL